MQAALAPLTAARTYVVGASVAGRGHVRRGVACQDRFSAEVLDDDTVLVAVSDGLGEAIHAAIGAEAASGAAVRAGRAVVRAAPDYPPSGLAHHMLSCARAHLLSVADAMQAPPADLACTLMTVVARRDSVCTAHIGDGSVIAETGSGFTLLSGPPAREYVNETDPLTAPDWAERVRVESLDGTVHSITVLTDGCQHAAIAPDGSVGEGFIPAVVEHIRALDADEEALHALLSGPKINEHSDDDKTLVVAILAP